jgi:hypothetical protein
MKERSMDRFFDPRRVPDGGRSLSLAVDLCAALALLDGDDGPRAWRRCRSAALRYLEAVRAGRFGPEVALDLLWRAVATWTPREVDAARGARLAARVPFWIDTVYGLRWRTEARASAPRPAAEPELAVARPLPLPGAWVEMRAWRDAMAAQRVLARERRLTRQRLAEARTSRGLALLAAGAECLERSRLAEQRSRQQ